VTRDRIAFLALGVVLGATGAVLFRGATAATGPDLVGEAAQTARLERRILELEALARRPSDLAAPPPPPGARSETASGAGVAEGPGATGPSGVKPPGGVRKAGVDANGLDGENAPEIASEIAVAIAGGPDAVNSFVRDALVADVLRRSGEAPPDWDAATTESKWRYGTDEEKAKALARLRSADSEDFLPVLRRALDPVPARDVAAGISNAIARLKDRPWSAKQATGAPDTPVEGDIGSAWASARADMGEVTLDLSYDRAVRVDAVRIHETLRPGAVARIQAKKPDGSWDTIWEGRSTAFDAPNWFAPAVAATAYTTTVIRIVVDTDRVENWNEIDAVELEGDGLRQWASSAVSSSSYADR